MCKLSDFVCYQWRCTILFHFKRCDASPDKAAFGEHIDVCSSEDVWQQKMQPECWRKCAAQKSMHFCEYLLLGSVHVWRHSFSQSEFFLNFASAVGLTSIDTIIFFLKDCIPFLPSPMRENGRTSTWNRSKSKISELSVFLKLDSIKSIIIHIIIFGCFNVGYLKVQPYQKHFHDMRKYES